MDIEKRQEIERAIVREVLTRLVARGWKIDFFDNGGGREKLTGYHSDPIDDVMPDAFAADTCEIYLSRQMLKTDWSWKRRSGVICLVLGNDGYDVIADHTCNDDFETVITEVTDKYEALCFPMFS